MPDGIQWTISGNFSHTSGQHTDVTIPAGDYGPYPILAGGIATRGGSTAPGENTDPTDGVHVDDHTVDLIIGGVSVFSTLEGTLPANHANGITGAIGNFELGAVELIGLPIIVAPWVERGYNVPSVNPLNGGGTIRIATNADTIDPIEGFNTEVGVYAWAILSTTELFTADFIDPILGPIFTAGPTEDVGPSDFTFGTSTPTTTFSDSFTPGTMSLYLADGITPNSSSYDPSAKYVLAVHAGVLDNLLMPSFFPIPTAPVWANFPNWQDVVGRTNIAAVAQATVSIGLFTKTTDPMDTRFTITNFTFGSTEFFAAAGGLMREIANSGIGRSAISYKPRSYAQVIG